MESAVSWESFKLVSKYLHSLTLIFQNQPKKRLRNQPKKRLSLLILSRRNQVDSEGLKIDSSEDYLINALGGSNLVLHLMIT